MKKNTQAEEQIIQILWPLETSGYDKDILELLDEPIEKAYRLNYLLN